MKVTKQKCTVSDLKEGDMFVAGRENYMVLNMRPKDNVFNLTTRLVTSVEPITEVQRVSEVVLVL